MSVAVSDNTSERVVQDALDKAKENRTTLVIAHRLSTIRNADLIVGFDQGQLVECGTHDELMQRQGLYYELVTAQAPQDKEQEEDDDEEEQEQEHIERQISFNRQLSRQSSGSAADPEDIADQSDLDHSRTTMALLKAKCCRQPFSLRILRLNAPEWPWILLGSISSLISGGVQPIFALFVSETYKLFGETDLHRQERWANIYAGLIFCTGLVAAIVDFLSSFSFAKSGEQLTMRMRTATFAALLRQEMAFFDHEVNSVGALVTRLSSDSSALKVKLLLLIFSRFHRLLQGLSGARVEVILQTMGAALTAIIISFSCGWKLTLVILCFAPILMLNSVFQGKKHATVDPTSSTASLAEHAGQYANQAMTHIRTVIILRREHYFIEHYESAFRQHVK